jgi:hypothetical protein
MDRLAHHLTSLCPAVSPAPRLLARSPIPQSRWLQNGGTFASIWPPALLYPAWGETWGNDLTGGRFSPFLSGPSQVAPLAACSANDPPWVLACVVHRELRTDAPRRILVHPFPRWGSRWFYLTPAFSRIDTPFYLVLYSFSDYNNGDRCRAQQHGTYHSTDMFSHR